MKTINKIKVLLAVFSVAILGGLQTVQAQPGINISFQQFYDELSPYGQWVDDPDYGYIWVPDVEPDFQPYATNGNWVMTDYGNTWVSNYQWGWAPFHYGRWNFTNRFGWYWVPGYEWGPAWVNWRSGGGYYGWAPLGPGVNIGVSVNIPANFWIFVPQRYIMSTNIHRYYVPRRTMVNVYNHTTIINNTYVYNNRRYAAGPGRSEIQRVTRTSVPVRRITTSNRPGATRVSGRSVEVYRPNITRNTAARPGRVTNSNNIRPSTPRAATTTNTRTNRDTRSTSARTTTSATRQTSTPRQTSASARSTGVSTSRPAASTRTVARPATSAPSTSSARPANTAPSRSVQTSRPATQVRSSAPARSSSRPAVSTGGNSRASSARSSAPRTGRPSRN